MRIISVTGSNSLINIYLPMPVFSQPDDIGMILIKCFYLYALIIKQI